MNQCYSNELKPSSKHHGEIQSLTIKHMTILEMKGRR
jgi:hypothetical protein